jgi:hypothetical protein
MFSLSGRVEGKLDITNPKYNVLKNCQVNATLIPLKYKASVGADGKTYYSIVSGDWSRTVCLNAASEVKSFSYQDLDIDFYSPEYPDSEYVGWRIAFTNEPKSDYSIHGVVTNFSISEIVPLNASTTMSSKNAESVVESSI